jgi:hypothetical protein
VSCNGTSEPGAGRLAGDGIVIVAMNATAELKATL